MRRIWAELRQYPITCGVLAGVVLCVATVLWRVDPLTWRLMSAAEREDRLEIQEIGEALQQYAAENAGYFPPASFSSGSGTPDLSATTEYLRPELVARLTSASKPRICYWGYVVVDDTLAQELFAIAHAPGAPVNPDGDLALDSGRDYGPYSTGKVIRRLAKGAGRSLVRDIGNPALNLGADLVPVLWEIPATDRLGGYVLFLDGHVEWVAYPGIFPMSETMADIMRRPLHPLAKSDLAPPRSPVQGIAWRVAELGLAEFQKGDLRAGARISQCDVSPTAKAGGASGYRVVMGRNDITTLPLAHVMARTYHPRTELVLFPVGGPVPERDAIRWTCRADAHECTYLGDGLGYRWYMNVGARDFWGRTIRVEMGLTGGDRGAGGG